MPSLQLGGVLLFVALLLFAAANAAVFGLVWGALYLVACTAAFVLGYYFPRRIRHD